MKKIFLQTLILLVLCTALAALNAWRAPIKTLEKDPFRIELSKTETLSPFQWIDCRSEEDYEKGHYPDAILINNDNYEIALGELAMSYDPDKALVCYCSSSCLVSKQIAERLRKDLGQDNIFYLKGGYQP